MERKILFLGDPRLYEISEEVREEELEKLRPVFEDMFDCIKGIRRDYGFQQRQPDGNGAESGGKSGGLQGAHREKRPAAAAADRGNDGHDALHHRGNGRPVLDRGRGRRIPPASFGEHPDDQR